MKLYTVYHPRCLVKEKVMTPGYFHLKGRVQHSQSHLSNLLMILRATLDYPKVLAMDL